MTKRLDLNNNPCGRGEGFWAPREA